MASDALDAKMERLGCVDLAPVTEVCITEQQQQQPSRTKSSDSLGDVLRTALISSTTTDSGVSSPDYQHSCSAPDQTCSRCVKTVCQNGRSSTAGQSAAAVAASASADAAADCQCNGLDGSASWAKYFDDCFLDAFEPLPTSTVMSGHDVFAPGGSGSGGGSGHGSRQTELDQLLDELNHNISLLNQTLDDPGVCHI